MITPIYNSEYAQLIRDYYELVFPCMSQISQNAYSAEIYGDMDVARRSYDQINDYHILLVLLLMIYDERRMDAQSDTICYLDKGAPYYYEKYNIECIKQSMLCSKCNTYNISKIFDLFGLDISQLLEGVGYDSIGPLSGNCPNEHELVIY